MIHIKDAAVPLCTQHTSFLSDLPVHRFLDIHAKVRRHAHPGSVVEQTLDFANQLTIEPTLFYELAYDTAVLARGKGLRNVFVTNGFIGEGALRQLARVLNAANVWTAKALHAAGCPIKPSSSGRPHVLCAHSVK